VVGLTRARHNVLCFAGARPNFVKLAPLVHALAGRPSVATTIVHTGQHWEASMSRVFFEQLDLPEAADNLGVGSGSHAGQTAAVMVGAEQAIAERRPDAVVVAGDVNSTLGAALAAAKLGVPLVHLEAGLRCGDWEMPEEVNRVVADRVADLLLAPSADAVENLRGEGIEPARIALVGNTMIDSLRRMLPHAGEARAVERLGLERHGFVLVTLHRPSLVDDPGQLGAVLGVLAEVASRMPMVFPAHPRTRDRLTALGDARSEALRLVEPVDYLAFLDLESSARLVVTDSGGVQEETSDLGVPCLTYRRTTERPVTVTAGTNRLVGLDPEALGGALREELAAEPDFAPAEIPLWDGGAGERAAQAVLRMLEDGEPVPRRSAVTALAE
jgi:UDP-N-acetylglucosamine 2-epimerase (non-hydrolysing)